MRFTDNFRNFCAENESYIPRTGVDLYPRSADSPTATPWDITVAEFQGTEVIRDVFHALSIRQQWDASASVPNIIHRSVLRLHLPEQRLPRGRWWYYILTLSTKTRPTSVREAKQQLRLYFSRLVAATPNELALLCGEWTPEENLTYRQILPLIAFGGRSKFVNHGGLIHDGYVYLDRGADETDHVTLSADYTLPSSCGILVRSRSKL